MAVFIGGAWPYANGPLHLGHVASLLPGDILARYYRLKGEEVLFVSGSDCHGTPIAIKAKQEGVAPDEVAGRYHNEFADCLDWLGFSYDLYSRTNHPFHNQEVQKIFQTLLEKGYLYKRTVQQTYCDSCDQFLPDRYVEGICPHCGHQSRGDQCESCSAILDPVEIIEKRCKLCGSTPEIKETDHYYFALSKFQQPLNDYLNNAKEKGRWRENAIHLTKRYLQEGLQDRAATRDLEYGVPVPVQGFERKKIYVWIEAVSGYLTASKQWAVEKGESLEMFWNDRAKSYYVHGKDNIPFHTIIWPAILMGIGGLKLPDYIVSSEFLTVESKKLSTSRNWAVWVPDLMKSYHPDSIRYFLTINAPERKDADFSWREFIYSHNSELLGAFGNFVNRTLKFIQKSFGGEISKVEADHHMIQRVKDLYIILGNLIEKGEMKTALEEVFSFVRQANKYFDEQKPWVQVHEDISGCKKTLYTCMQIIANLSILLNPFLPFSCEEIQKMLNIKDSSWRLITLGSVNINRVNPLFNRIDLERIELERERLGE